MYKYTYLENDIESPYFTIVSYYPTFVNHLKKFSNPLQSLNVKTLFLF